MLVLDKMSPFARMPVVLAKVAAFAKNPDHWIYAIAVTVLMGFATGAFAQSGSVYSLRGAQTASPVARAVVLQSREVAVEAPNPVRYSGAATGAALGGALGAALGHSSARSQVALGLIGATLGGLSGQLVAENYGGTRAVEYIVQTEQDGQRPGRVIAITQPEPGPSLTAGDQVYLIQTSGTWRVVRAMVQAQQAAEQAPQQVPSHGAEIARSFQNVSFTSVYRD